MLNTIIITVTAVIIGVPLVILSIVALVTAAGASRRLREASQRISSLEMEVYRLGEQAAKYAATAPGPRPEAATEEPSVSNEPAALEAAPAADAEERAPDPAGRTTEMLAAEEEEPEADEAAAADVAPAADEAAAADEAPAADEEPAAKEPTKDEESAAEDMPAAAAGAAPALPASQEHAADVAMVSKTSIPAAPAGTGGEVAHPASAPPQSIEEKIGLVWFTRIGALIGILVAGWFFKYMVDNNWIGPWGRVALGAAAGLALLGGAELMARRKKAHAIFVQGLVGLGLALLLVTAYAAFEFYHLLSVTLTFVCVAALAVLGGALALRHRAESILMLSLLAVFLSPVLLSTGKDRPLALFSYLFVMTSGGLYIAVRRKYHIALWTSVAGVVVLAIGWYVRFYEPHGPLAAAGVDGPAAALQGAYFHLASRWAPLVFSAVFTLQWAAAGLMSRRNRQRVTPLILYLTAAGFAHAAFTALLYDNPVVLGAVLCGVGVGAAALLVRQGHLDWLGLPMLASFAALAGVSGQIGSGRLLPMMIVAGGLASIYGGVFLWTATKQRRLATPITLASVGGAGLGLVGVSALWLLPAHALIFGALVCGLSVGYLWLTAATRSMVLLLAAFVSSLACMSGVGSIGVDSAGTTTRVGFLVLSGLWFSIYLGFSSIELVLRNAAWTGVRMAVLAGAGVGFGALFIMGSSSDAELLRALLSAVTGVLYLGLGLRLWSGEVEPADEDKVLYPLGLAVTFVTLTLAFLLSGPGLTTSWAAEAAILAYLARRVGRRGQPGHPAWLIAALVIFGVAAVRFLAYDLMWLSQQRAQLWITQGQEGLFMPTAFLHPRAWSLLAIGAGLLLSAWFISGVRARPFFRHVTLALVITGHLMLLGLFISEARILFTSLPGALPRGLPVAEFTATLNRMETALVDQAARLDMITTVVLGLYAIATLAFGFVFRDRTHRLIGIVLFGVTVGKLGLYDIWSLETVYRIVVGAAIATLLLAGGFLYARFSGRIKTLLVEDDSPATTDES